ncbi:hypothetical protein EMIT0P253_160030 [Pseudomonas sp. IT-P253]
MHMYDIRRVYSRINEWLGKLIL